MSTNDEQMSEKEDSEEVSGEDEIDELSPSVEDESPTRQETETGTTSESDSIDSECDSEGTTSDSTDDGLNDEEAEELADSLCKILIKNQAIFASKTTKGKPLSAQQACWMLEKYLEERGLSDSDDDLDDSEQEIEEDMETDEEVSDGSVEDVELDDDDVMEVDLTEQSEDEDVEESSEEEPTHVDVKITKKLEELKKILPEGALDGVEIEEITQEEAESKDPLKAKNAFWKHVKYLYEERNNGKMTPEDYKEKLIKVFAQRIKIRRKVDEIYARKKVKLCKNNKKPRFPCQKFVDSFYKNYNHLKDVRHELTNPRLMPTIDRLRPTARGQIDDYWVERGDIMTATSPRTGLPCYAMISNIFWDENMKPHASLMWLAPKKGQEVDPNEFDPEKYEISFMDERLHPLKTLKFECHKPSLPEYEFEKTTASEVQAKYRKVLKKQLRKVDSDKKRDLEVKNPQQLLTRLPKKPLTGWIERRETVSRNKSGFLIIKQTLKAGRETGDCLFG